MFDYESILLQALPRPCLRALDVGCGHGHFARRLAAVADEVDALDRVDLGVTGPPNLRFVPGDFLQIPVGHYDFVSSIASLHHMPFAEAIGRMKDALRPGGVLGIIGLYRDAGLGDFCWSSVAFPLSFLRRRGSSRAPLREPTMTLREIRAAAAELLPGARFLRHLMWRYTLVWTKP
jgi:SAM-dependent methyltransferase